MKLCIDDVLDLKTWFNFDSFDRYPPLYLVIFLFLFFIFNSSMVIAVAEECLLVRTKQVVVVQRDEIDPDVFGYFCMDVTSGQP